MAIFCCKGLWTVVVKVGTVRCGYGCYDHRYKKQKTIVEENITKYLNWNLDMFEYVQRISYHYKQC